MQVENLKSALRKLEEKLNEAQLKNELLAAEHRRARALHKASTVELAVNGNGQDVAIDRIKERVAIASALGEAKSEVANRNIEDRLAALEKRDQVERLLEQIKSRRS